MKYDYAKAFLDFTSNNGLEFHLQLRPRITIVRGDSATGKSFLVKSIQTAKKSHRDLNLHDLDNVELFNPAAEFPKDEKKLIIIDRGDLVIDEQVRMKILQSSQLQFLIFMRVPMSLALTPNYYGTLVKKDNVIEINYSFSERLWFV